MEVILQKMTEFVNLHQLDILQSIGFRTLEELIICEFDKVKVNASNEDVKMYALEISLDNQKMDIQKFIEECSNLNSLFPNISLLLRFLNILLNPLRLCEYPYSNNKINKTSQKHAQIAHNQCHFLFKLQESCTRHNRTGIDFKFT